jgi:hypothetical protein
LTPCRAVLFQVLYSAVMVPWSVSFQPSSCGDASANSAGGACASATLTARRAHPAAREHRSYFVCGAALTPRGAAGA